MNNTRVSIVLGVISTLIFLALLPHLIQDFFNDNTGIIKRISYLVIPLFVVLMWRQILSLLKNGNTHNSEKPDNTNTKI